MKKAFNKKKGFTIVELVIVVAVIGVLTAILVPTFVNLTNKANEASNQAFVKNLNTAMAMREAEEGKNKTMSEAVEDAKAIGFDVEKLTPVNGRDLVWDSVSNRFLLLEPNGDVWYGKEDKKATKDVDIWKVYAKAADVPSTQIYSIYAGGNAWSGDLQYTVGFDAGANVGITSVSYVRTTGAAQNVVFRTQGGTLTVNAPNDHVEHFGIASVINVNAVSGTTYVERGSVAKMVIGEDAKNVVLEETSFVNTLENNNATVTIDNKGYVAEVTGTSPEAVTPSTGAIKVFDFEQLQSLALASSDNDYDFAGKTIQLQNDIDMTGRTWVPFGLSVNRAFSGEFDGNEKTIKGLSYSPDVANRLQKFSSESDEGTPFALISYAEKNVFIHDLTIEADINVPGGEAVAAFIGVFNNLTATKTGDESISTLHLKNCTAKGNIAAKHKVAGLIGTAFITQGRDFANAHVGEPNYRAKTNITFDHCVNEANVVATRTSNGKAGGFSAGLPLFRTASATDVGGSTLSILNGCVNKGTVSISGTDYYGSFCGYLTGNGGAVEHAQFTDQSGLGKEAYVTSSLAW